MRADDGTARHARQHVDVAQHVELGEPRQHADVEQRRARKPPPDRARPTLPATMPRSASLASPTSIASVRQASECSGMSTFCARASVASWRVEDFELPGRRIERERLAQPVARLGVAAEGEQRLGHGRAEPPLLLEPRVRRLRRGSGRLATISSRIAAACRRRASAAAGNSGASLAAISSRTNAALMRVYPKSPASGALAPGRNRRTTDRNSGVDR